MDFRERLKTGYLILDGGMGTGLQAKGMALGEHPERLNFTAPETVLEVHRRYVEAGSEVIYTNTFQANRLKLPADMTVEETVKRGIELGKKAGAKFIAQDIGPTGGFIEPMGNLTFEEAYDLFAEQVKAGVKYGADLFVLETFNSLYEMKAALLAVKENSALPVVCTMSYEANGRTVNGTAVSAMALTLEGLGADAIGFNCSVGAAEMIPLVEELKKWTNLPIAVKANAGIPNGKIFTPQEFADCYRIMMKNGITLAGGCCGTTPEYVRELNKLKETLPYALRPYREIPFAVCSESRTVLTDEIRVVGERINPTGKKRMKEALKSGDYGYIAEEALGEKENAAEILDVNCGIPEIDEEEILPLLVKKVQSVVDCPVMIDTTNPVALEKALRVVNGVPIVNSVNGDTESMETVLPLVKKYGAGVVGLCLDKEGIPSTGEARVAVGRQIAKGLERHGIPLKRLFLDPLTLTVATGEYPAEDCLNSVRTFKKEGIKSILGISNISFGLPNREIINASFLTAAMNAGLNLAIMNPSSELMMDMVSAYRLLMMQTDSRGGIKGFQVSAAQRAAAQQKEECTGLVRAVVKGLKEDAVKETELLLETFSPKVVIEEHLIKGLDKVGELYEKQTIFLPQLIASADAAKAAFSVVGEKLPAGGQTKGAVLLATVKGDIHDIGKNIVRAVVENYGYRVVDLGKDVAPETIVEKALAENIGLVGLSALMTTTAVSMEQTVVALKQAGYRGKIMVGGAVITPEFAKKIGADYYAKDANASVKIAMRVFGK